MAWFELRREIPDKAHLTGIWHGTRNGFEESFIAAHGGHAVIGTEVSDTAERFEHTVQWDFHDVNEGRVAKFDFFYPSRLNQEWAKAVRSIPCGGSLARRTPCRCATRSGSSWKLYRQCVRKRASSSATRVTWTNWQGLPRIGVRQVALVSPPRRGAAQLSYSSTSLAKPTGPPFRPVCRRCIRSRCRTRCADCQGSSVTSSSVMVTA